MPVLLLLLIWLLTPPNFSIDHKVVVTDKVVEIDTAEAKLAFEFLTSVRSNPEIYYKELHYKQNIKVSTVKLQWNDTLAAVAEEKAADMAKRNYFAHVNPDGAGINYLISAGGYKLNPAWLKNKRNNNFESIAANVTGGEDAIRLLIIDENTPSLGHRKHLLGLDDWNSTLEDIGIGFVRCGSGCRYETYVSVIIAKHDW